MKFWKMNGAGNDFIVIDNREGTIGAEQWPRIARTLCERHLSIGADGLMVVEMSLIHIWEADSPRNTSGRCPAPGRSRTASQCRW